MALPSKWPCRASPASTMHVTSPVFPERAVRPAQWTNAVASTGRSYKITWRTSGKSSPRTDISVATRTCAVPLRKHSDTSWTLFEFSCKLRILNPGFSLARRTWRCSTLARDAAKIKVAPLTHSSSSFSASAKIHRSFAVFASSSPLK